MASHRRDLLQIVAEAEEEHDLVLHNAALVCGRDDREPLAVGMDIVRVIVVPRPRSRGRPDLRFLRAERIADHGVRRAITLPWFRNSSSCAVADQAGKEPPSVEIRHLPPGPGNGRT